jgi:hypothetical protein
VGAVSGFRDALAQTREFWGGDEMVPNYDDADAILAMPEMQAVGELIDVVTLWAAMKVTNANLLGEFRSMQETLGPVYLAIEEAGRP